MKPTFGYDGLRRRPRFDEMVEFVQYQQPFLKYPDRRAKQLRESPYLTQLDGDGFDEMQEQQEKAMKEQEKQNEIKRLAGEEGETASLIRSMLLSESNNSRFSTANFRNKKFPNKKMSPLGRGTKTLGIEAVASRPRRLN